MLAGAHGQLGEVEAALGRIAEALAAIEKSREGVWEAEAHRLKGELLLAQSHDSQSEAEACR